MSTSFAECSARERIGALLDTGSFEEWLPPAERVMSPHLGQLGVPSAFDDGVAVGRGRLDGRPVFIAAQEGQFIGGGTPSSARCGLVTRSDGGNHSTKLPGSSSASRRSRAEHSAKLVVMAGSRARRAPPGPAAG